jgi:Kdo2-lipid IVA lauroyltransferase/acyltransferase
MANLFQMLWVLVMIILSWLPLRALRALGAVVGFLLYKTVKKRAHVARVNLKLCFPHWSQDQVEAQVVKAFQYFSQAWLDRSWLWHGSAQKIESRFNWAGDMGELAHLLDGSEVGSTEGALMVFAPHFVGLDVAWTALSLKRSGPLSTIYTPQSSKVADAWMRASRARFGRVNLFTREDGVKRIISGLKKGELLYLLPDMNFGPEESIFVPFFGIPAATVPSLSRFAKLSGARVIPVTTLMTDQGYEIKVHESFKDFPSEDFVRDTAFMNQWLEDIIKVKPDQYFWLHKRFKTRPDSEKSFYD